MLEFREAEHRLVILKAKLGKVGRLYVDLGKVLSKASLPFNEIVATQPQIESLVSGLMGPQDLGALLAEFREELERVRELRDRKKELGIA